jgi:hypothetical protein
MESSCIWIELTLKHSDHFVRSYCIVPRNVQFPMNCASEKSVTDAFSQYPLSKPGVSIVGFSSGHSKSRMESLQHAVLVVQLILRKETGCLCGKPLPPNTYSGDPLQSFWSQSSHATFGRYQWDKYVLKVVFSGAITFRHRRSAWTFDATGIGMHSLRDVTGIRKSDSHNSTTMHSLSTVSLSKDVKLRICACAFG